MTAKLSKELSDALNGGDELEAVDPATGRVYVIVDSTVFRETCAKRVREAIQRGIDSMAVGGGMPLEQADSQLRRELGFPGRQ